MSRRSRTPTPLPEGVVANRYQDPVFRSNRSCQPLSSFQQNPRQEPRRQEPESQQSLPRQIMPPDYLVCPILYSLFRDPVILSSGKTYDREAVEVIMGDAKRAGRTPVDPLTREEVCGELWVNWQIREAVEAFLDENPGFDPGWEDEVAMAVNRRFDEALYGRGSFSSGTEEAVWTSRGDETGAAPPRGHDGVGKNWWKSSANLG